MPPDAHWSERSSVVTATSPCLSAQFSFSIPSSTLHKLGLVDANGEDPAAPKAAKPKASSTGHSLSPLSVSFIKVKKQHLPFTQMITLSTPLLYIQIGKVTVTFEFLRVSSGRLSIAQVSEAERGSLEPKIVHVKDIPTTSELRVPCLQESHESNLQLHDGEIGLLAISFAWGDIR
ncbi:hypothetical protein NA56DRAFT_754236 [Hyaloscypha hepaticicola]|uniref:Uncharacterized protein n=1 Tax=Hyaloscypha hepaticicola TaxID=2082293 RepID=A0A2J6PMK1_9HELO|nr:hypothetical protein NA56DRAFT_754236 [Hyaloscypha hepaticicola]